MEIRCNNKFFRGEIPHLFLKAKGVDQQLFHEILSCNLDHKTNITKEYHNALRFEQRPDQRVLAMLEVDCDFFGGMTPRGVGNFPPYRWRREDEGKPLSLTEKAHFMQLLTQEDRLTKEMKTLVMPFSGSALQRYPSRSDQE